ncbi:serine protease [Candidatus Parcubacteria bacterium]|nr:serine protease [Candidatus Parcubacteria bacterium]
MNRPPSMFNLVVLTVVIAVVAGFGGYMLAKSIAPISDIGYFNLINGQEDIKINLEQPLINIATHNQSSIAGIYRPVKAIATVGQPLLTPGDFLGSAVVVTSDGWLMTTDQVLNNTSGLVALGDELYEIQEIKKDTFVRVVFLKIEADSLQPVNFQLTNEIKEGERLVTNIDLPNSMDHSFYATFLANSHYFRDRYLSTDEFDYYLSMADVSLPKSGILSAPFFNTDSYLLGLTYQEDQDIFLLPAEYLKQSVKHLLDGTERVLLGIRYVDLENNTGFNKKGNLVYHPQLRAVDYNSSAYKAGLQSGDQVVAINNDIISDAETLTSIIQDYRQGDKIILKILRDEAEQDLEIQL